MDTGHIVLMLVAAVMAAGVLRLCRGMEWPWGLAVLLALVPLAATFFFGIFGLIGAAAFVGSLYKAAV